MKKNYLLTPGPTPVPPEVLRAMAKPIIHHRKPEYRKIFQEVITSLAAVFKTKNDILTFTCSGTGAMEACVANLLSKGERAIVVRGGKFGQRWEEICQAYNVEVLPIDVEWGESVNPNLIAEELTNATGAGPVGAVFTTLCETSTAVVNDIEAIAKIVKEHSALLVVDAISGLGADNLETDNWGVDIVVAASQKALMVPPGLAFVSVSRKAWNKIEASEFPRYYFDFRSARKGLEKFESPFTPAISLMIALNESLKLINGEGVDNVLARNKRLAHGLQAAVKTLGLELFAPGAPANAVTAVKVPEGIDGQELVKLLNKNYSVIVAGGQAHLKGRIFRIAHMGYITEEDLLFGISALEKVLVELGHKVELGVGVKAAEEIFRKKERMA